MAPNQNNWSPEQCLKCAEEFDAQLQLAKYCGLLTLNLGHF
jgi:hypothetical protein